MWIQKLPATRPVTRITLGDVAVDTTRCTSDGVWSLILFESLEGQLFFANEGRQVRSVGVQTVTSELGRITWTIPPTTLYAGRGYWVELVPESGCRDLVRRTWAHDGGLVNSGPHHCVYNSYIKENGRPYRMWHEAGQDDSHPQCVFGGRADGEPLFDPAMPAGWLTTISYNGNDRYVARRWTGLTSTSPCGDTNLANMGLEETFWRAGPAAQGNELVCRWTQFAPPGQEVPNGWFYALYWTKARAGTPRDMYLKLDYTPADVAQVFRPNLYFDSSEEWRPLDIDRFFAETDHQVCSHSGCVRVSRPDDLAQSADSQYLDISGDGDGSNYKSPFPECNVGLRECDTGPRSAAYFREFRGSGEYRYFDYWFFYRFNDNPAVADSLSGEDLRHEGDWESVTVGVPSVDAETFDFASFSQHGQWYSYLRSALRCDGGNEGSCGNDSQPLGNRVSVFVANRGHANYPRPCSAPETPIIGGQVFCGQDGSANPEAGAYDGARPWGNNNLQSALLPFRNSGEGYQWEYWWGRWGATGTDGSSSPRSPSQQTGRAWDSPGDFNCPERDSPCGAAASSAQVTGRHSANRCQDWFGHDVTAIVCDEARLRSALRRGELGEEGSTTLDATGIEVAQASAPGLAQLVGDPLGEEDQLVVRGDIAATARLLVRAQMRRGVGIATFDDLGRHGRGPLEIRVSRGRVSIVDRRTDLVVRARPLIRTIR